MTPKLQISYNGTTREFVAGTTVMIGRDPHCTVVVNDDRVSRRHLSLYVENDEWIMVHLSKSNPTFLNGQPVTQYTLAEQCVFHLSVPTNGPIILVDLVEDNSVPDPDVPQDLEIEAAPEPRKSVPLRAIVEQRAVSAASTQPDANSERVRNRLKLVRKKK